MEYPYPAHLGTRFAILLVAAVFLSTFKTVQWYLGILGLVVLAGLLFLAIKGFSKKDEVQEDVEAG